MARFFFLLFDIASARQVPFGIPRYVQYTHQDLHLSSFVSHFFFADNPRYQFVVAC